MGPGPPRIGRLSMGATLAAPGGSFHLLPRWQKKGGPGCRGIRAL